MKNLRYLFRLTVAFLKKFKGLLVIGIVIGIIFYAGITLALPRISASEEVRIGVTGRYTVEELPPNINFLISKGLTRVTDSGIPEPSLATSWETPDQGKTWIFNLGNYQWHDGENVNSENIRYNFSNVEIERPNDKTLVFNLESPYSPFPVVVSKQIFKKGLLGTGDWSVENLVVSNGYVQDLVLVNEEQNRRIYKFFPNEDRTKLALKLGEVSRIEGLFEPNPFLDWNTVESLPNENNQQIVTIFFNLESEMFRDNKPLRQALSYAVNKRKLGPTRALSPISPNSWAYNPQVKDYSFDPERAKQLLSDFPKEVLEQEIKLSTNNALLDVAEQIEKDWENIGLNVSINVTPILQSDYQAFLTIFDIPQDPDQYQLWHSTQIDSNISNYKSDRIDGLLEQGRATLNLEDRKRIYLDFQRFLLEDAPAVFLYHPVYYDIYKR